MDITINQEQKKNGIEWLARAGLIAKGCVYILLGIFALLAALHIGGQSATDSDKSGIFQFLDKSFIGKWLLPLLAVGLLCYSIWRCIEAVRTLDGSNKQYSKAIRYFFSAAVYLFVCFSAVKFMLNKRVDKTDQQQHFASELLSQPFGKWLLAAAAIVIAGIGIYQLYYGWSEKYKKHTQKMRKDSGSSSVLLTAGKIGYVARGIVWVVIAYLMSRAAFTGSSSKAGDTGKAFAFIETLPAGSLWLAVVAVGLLAYGLFAFVRSRYEQFV